ncbi:MAG: hypothetical protein KDD68_20220 [Bdellovibrionales bacterium]|nr:hypothetical protein [Bdellovibrionales bacterium]
MSSVKLLNPLVRSDKVNVKATDREMMEYAIALVFAGSIEEGLALLNEVDEDSIPEVTLHRAIAHFNRWEYDRAIPYLEKFVQYQSEGYLLGVGRVNLASAYIFTSRFQDAKDVLDRIISRAIQEKNLLLEGYARELYVQVCIFSEEAKTSIRDSIDMARRCLSDANLVGRLYVDKWSAVAELKEGNSVGLRRLLEVRDRAIQIRNWETARDCDFQRLSFTKDQNLFDQLFIGTPFPEYRARMQRLFGELNVPVKFAFEIDSERPGVNVKSRPWVDMLSLESNVKNFKIKAGHLFHRLLLSLTRDFYVPTNVNMVFAALHPKEYFNPVTSPQRVYSLVNRFNMEMDEAKVPMQVEVRNGCYRVVSVGCSVRLLVYSEEVSAARSRLAAYKAGDCINSAQLAKEFGVSSRTAARWLREAIGEGAVVSERKGREIYYRVL